MVDQESLKDRISVMRIEITVREMTGVFKEIQCRPGKAFDYPEGPLSGGCYPISKE